MGDNNGAEASARRGGGRLVVLLSDIRRLACDAWLVPGARLTAPHLAPCAYSWVAKLGPVWFETVEGYDRVHRIRPKREGDKQKGEAKEEDKEEAKEEDKEENKEGKEEEDKEIGGQVVVGCDINMLGHFDKSFDSFFNGSGGTTAQARQVAEWVCEGVRQALRLMHAGVVRRPPRNGRANHLLALPVVGTGFSGGASATGTILDALLTLLAAACQDLGVDIALVCADLPTYAHAQQWRKAREDGQWGELSPALRDAGRRLAANARAEKLALFLGAGVSVGAGLPTWPQLLSQIHASSQSKLPPNEFLELTYQERASHLVEVLGGKEQLASEVAARLTVGGDQQKFCVLHALLATMPVKQVITTNYDVLFEAACDAVEVLNRDRPYSQARLSVLPYRPIKDHSRWLLKMHGCVQHPEDIVLTKEDYANYMTAKTAALGGMVQGTMMTSQLLFVGFSMDDRNYHRIVDSVKSALGDSVQCPADLGTTLQLVATPPRADLGLQPEPLCMVDDAEAEAASLSLAARTLELFVDFVVAQSVSMAHFLLDGRFKHNLGDDERALRAHLVQFVEQLPKLSNPQDTAGLDEVVAMLDELGLKNARAVVSAVTQGRAANLTSVVGSGFLGADGDGKKKRGKDCKTM